jgi:yecA family protein
MLTAKEKKTLKLLLNLAPEPDMTFTYDELLGFMFGLAITPDIIPPSEWLPVIFAGDIPEYDSMEQMKEMTGCLMQVYNKYTAAFQEERLSLPFAIDTLDERQLNMLYDWVSGLEEALALREEIWDPEENTSLPDKIKEELYHAMMIIQGLVDPLEVIDFFDNLPEDIFAEAFDQTDTELDSREMQIQLFLMTALPMAVETFQNHGRRMERKRQQQFSPVFDHPDTHPTKVGRNDPCPCNSGRKFKKCCGSPPKKSNVIKVDFPQHGRKKKPGADIYQIKVSLQGAKPPIWRRILVPGNTSLEKLHHIIQICMGWDNCHLHQFLIDGTCYSLPDEDDIMRTSRPKNEAAFSLHDLGDKIQPRFQYIYDFGDNWLHQIEVEKTVSPEKGKPYPQLVAGRRSCPPEDSGGLPGYQELLAILDNPEDYRYEEMTDWAGEDFDPAGFGKDEIATINQLLKELF